MKIQLDARDSHPAKFHEFVNAEGSPRIFKESGHVPKRHVRLRVVLGDVPGAASRDIEELGHDYWVGLFRLRVQRVFGRSHFECVNQGCFVHIQGVRK